MEGLSLRGPALIGAKLYNFLNSVANVKMGDKLRPINRQKGKQQMGQFSPSVERAASILTFMADHPDRSFTVSDLVRALKISRSTCYTLVSSLVKVGFLYRANDKMFLLGPTLASIGKTAAEHASPLLIAQYEMRVLAEEFDVICTSYSRERENLVVLDRVASGSNLGWAAPKGARMKLRAPFGAAFYAWSAPEVIDAWLTANPPLPTAEQRSLMQQSMAFAREHGFSVSVSSVSAAELRIDESADSEIDMRSQFPVSPVGAIEADQQYPLYAILAPVFDAKGEVAFVLSMLGFTELLPGTQILHLGQRLREACDRVSAFVGGSNL